MTLESPSLEAPPVRKFKVQVGRLRKLVVDDRLIFERTIHDTVTCSRDADIQELAHLCSGEKTKTVILLQQEQEGNGTSAGMVDAVVAQARRK